MLRSLVVLALVGCTGTEPIGAPRLVWSVEALDFASVPVGQVASLPVEFTNEGSGEVRLLSALISAGDRDLWRVDWERGSVLDAGASTTVLVSFQPDEPEVEFGGELHVRTNLSSDPGVFIPLVGWGSASINDEDGDGVTIADGDCDDGDPEVYPGAPERCNGRDDDCDGEPEADEVDADGDGARLCDADCDDANPDVYVGAPEICDQLDNNCDGVVPDELDVDGDGLTICDADCDDEDPTTYPGAMERCGDNRDNDCDGTIDSLDLDADGHDACGEAPDCDDSDPALFPRVVGPGGDDGAVGSWDEPLATVQAGFDSMLTGCDVVYLQAGVYSGAVGSAGGRLIGRGSGPGDVVIEGPGRVLDLSGGAWSLRNLRLVDGDTPEAGGGLRITSGSLALRDVEFVNNTALAGGGLAALDAQVSLSGGNLFEGNLATEAGGGMFVDGGLLFDFSGVSYLNNEAGTDGGALYATSAVRVSGARFEGNSAVGRGGAVALVDGGGHVLQRSLAVFNEADEGGAFAFDGVLEGRFRNNLLASNTATHGGGVWFGSGAGLLANNTLVDNEADLGAALYLMAPDALVLANIAHFNAGEGAFWTHLAAPNATHNTVFGTAGADYVGGWAPGSDGNRSENPGFVLFSDDGDPSNDILSLQAGSPSVDSGPTDTFYNDPDGSRNDRGHTGGPGAL